MDAARPLADRTAIVTGSTGEGMGRQTALRLARMGANLVLNYGTYRRSKRGADQAVRLVESFGVQAVAVEADTRDEAAMRRLVATAKRRFGPIDVAVANAGGDFLDRPWDTVGLAAWKRVVDAELDGAYLLAREVLPAMRRRRWGRFVLIGWEGAERAHRPPLDYSVGKMARHALASKLARAEEAHGVTVNVVSPGYIPYPTARQARDLARHGAAWTGRTRSTTQDVAEAVGWLCTEEARFVTGSTLRIYGPH